MPSRTSLRTIVFRLVSLVWTIAIFGIAGVTGAFIFVQTASLVFAIIGSMLVLFIGIGPLRHYQRRIEMSLPSKSVEIRQLDPSTAESRAHTKWRKLSLGELVLVQAVIALLFGYLLISLFPNVPLLSACVVSIVFVMVGTMLLRLIIARWPTP